MKIQRITYLSLGTNLGNKLENLQKAIDRIADKIGTVLKIAPVYKTSALGFDGEDFYNTCVQVSTYLSPEALLQTLQQIEQQAGRKKKENKAYENRILDIDILLFGDEIIFSKTLLVPHQHMLQRKFVLVPLTDIAKNTVHPVAKKQLFQCLKDCTDSSSPSLVTDTLQRPIPISEKYNYIAIEGNIGAGKTSLAHLLSDDFNARKVLERFADNPFLPKFYEDQERYAFPLEMSFLADRYQQLTDDLAQYDLFKNFVVSDYYIFKSLIFAQVTLPKEEYLLYRKMFTVLYKDIVKPDLYIYLYQNTERLLENIQKRGRSYEQNIEAGYLQKIHDGYHSFIQTQEGLNTLVIDVSDLDFVNNPADYKKVINTILQA